MTEIDFSILNDCHHVHEIENLRVASDFLADGSLHCPETLSVVDREIRSGMNLCSCGIGASFGYCSPFYESQSHPVSLKNCFDFPKCFKRKKFGFYLPRLGENERLRPREPLLVEDDLRCLPFEDLRLPRRLSPDETDLDRLHDRDDGLRWLFLTGLLGNNNRKISHCCAARNIFV